MCEGLASADASQLIDSGLHNTGLVFVYYQGYLSLCNVCHLETHLLLWM